MIMTRLWFVFYNFFITAQWVVVLVLKCQSCSSVLAGTCFSKIWLLTHYAMAISPSGKIDLVNKPVEQSYSEIISALPKKIDVIQVFAVCCFIWRTFRKQNGLLKDLLKNTMIIQRISHFNYMQASIMRLSYKKVKVKMRWIF